MDGGGVLIATKDDLICEEIPVDTPCEMVAMKIHLAQHQPLIVISAYRPTNRDVEYDENLCQAIQTVVHNHPNAAIWAAGDFNLPDVNWNMDTIEGHRYPLAISENFINMANDLGLTQVVDFPTRESNTLDLFFTNRLTLVNRSEPLPGISDHEIVFIDSNVTAKRQKPTRRKIHLWNSRDFDKIRKEVDNFVTKFVNVHSSESSVDQMWDEIKTKLQDIIW